MFLHKVGILCVMLAEFLKESDRELYTFLMFCIYVDDLANSNSTIRSCIDLAKGADELFATVGLQCKGWTEEDPPDRFTKDGLSLGVAGLRWLPKLDAVQVKNPVLQFGSRRQGKLDNKTIFFNGNRQVEGDGRPSY